MRLYGAAVLPQEFCCNKTTVDPPSALQGSYLVQVSGVKNITKAPNSILDVETETKKRPNRTLVVEFTVCFLTFCTQHSCRLCGHAAVGKQDGVNTCKGIELAQLDVLSFVSQQRINGFFWGRHGVLYATNSQEAPARDESAPGGAHQVFFELPAARGAQCTGAGRQCATACAPVEGSAEPPRGEQQHLGPSVSGTHKGGL